MSEEVYEVTSHWADDRFHQPTWKDSYQRPQDLVFGLGSAELVAAEWRRLKLLMRSDADIRAFLACTEYAALDCVAETIVADTNKEHCESLLKTLVLVRASEAAEPILSCKVSAKTPAIARDWLDKNIGCAVAGLIGVAGGRGKLADAALDYLRDVKRKGYGSVIAAAIAAAGLPEAAARIQAAVLDREEKLYDPFDAKSTPAWLAKELPAVGRDQSGNRFPAWATPATLPPLLVGERRLNDEQVAVVLQVLAATPAGERHPLLTKRAARRTWRKESATSSPGSCFNSGKHDGYPSKEKWAMGRNQLISATTVAY